MIFSLKEKKKHPKKMLMIINKRIFSCPIKDSSEFYSESITIKEFSFIEEMSKQIKSYFKIIFVLLI